MGGVAGGRLAAAVSAAGALGMIGMGSAGSAVALERELPYVHEVSASFGIGLVDWVASAHPQLLDAAIAAQPRLISISFGEDLSWVERVRAAGIITATQVYDDVDARRAADAGVEVLVARGTEGGGHGAPRMATLPLLDTVLSAVSVPVLAAGGIGSAATLAAVLAAGASGAWLGTCLAACSESLLSPRARQAMVAAQGTDTTVTRVFDIGMELPWPSKFPARVLRNEFSARWSGREPELAQNSRAKKELAAAVIGDQPRVAPVDAGQGVGMVIDIEPAGLAIERLCAGAAQLLPSNR
ncbi:NAD(P)H-dependent flavin oxidoreductase [Nocardia sp. NBC_01388]|uniref:NAD(P)H-dependent flavin oxidoreductase n=1 Tax=Nocardia sp. NBC_01388 TaxID=2903596 RepID=UPI00324660D1